MNKQKFGPSVYYFGMNLASKVCLECGFADSSGQRVPSRIEISDLWNPGKDQASDKTKAIPSSRKHIQRRMP
jgi:hypothetical protein